MMKIMIILFILFNAVYTKARCSSNAISYTLDKKVSITSGGQNVEYSILEMTIPLEVSESVCFDITKIDENGTSYKSDQYELKFDKLLTTYSVNGMYPTPKKFPNTDLAANKEHMQCYCDCAGPQNGYVCTGHTSNWCTRLNNVYYGKIDNTPCVSLYKASTTRGCSYLLSESGSCCAYRVVPDPADGYLYVFDVDKRGVEQYTFKLSNSINSSYVTLENSGTNRDIGILGYDRIEIIQYNIATNDELIGFNPPRFVYDSAADTDSGIFWVGARFNDIESLDPSNGGWYKSMRGLDAIAYDPALLKSYVDMRISTCKSHGYSMSTTFHRNEYIDYEAIEKMLSSNVVLEHDNSSHPDSLSYTMKLKTIGNRNKLVTLRMYVQAQDIVWHEVYGAVNNFTCALTQDHHTQNLTVSSIESQSDGNVQFKMYSVDNHDEGDEMVANFWKYIDHQDSTFYHQTAIGIDTNIGNSTNNNITYYMLCSYERDLINHAMKESVCNICTAQRIDRETQNSTLDEFTPETGHGGGGGVSIGWFMVIMVGIWHAMQAPFQWLYNLVAEPIAHIIVIINWIIALVIFYIVSRRVLIPFIKSALKYQKESISKKKTKDQKELAKRLDNMNIGIELSDMDYLIKNNKSRRSPSRQL